MVNLFAVRALTLFATALAVACGPKEPPIPPVIVPPEPPKPPVEDVFNKLGFTPHKEGEPFDTYRGLVMAGYQGWFGGPRDEGGFGDEGWYHYRENNMFRPGVLQNSIDFWPDMREYTQKYTPGVDASNVPSGQFILPDGSPAQVFSSYDESTVMLHFRWMKEYGVDGVFMQRFVGETVNNPNHKRHFDKVLANAMKASNEYQRAICVMYDLGTTGGGFMSPGRGVAELLADTDEIATRYNLKDRSQQKYYLHHNGKPLIVLWGVGFNDGRAPLTDIETLMNGLRERGFSIMLGVPTYWRTRNNDTVSDAKLHALIKAADVIMPWFVGRFGEHNYAPTFEKIVKDDIAWCSANNVDYAPLCYPGSSDRNMHPRNEINPRNGGSFYWKQIYNSINSGAKMLYIAMFDEIDEGTAIFKCLNQKDVPANAPATDYWVYYQDGTGYRKVGAEANIPSGASWRGQASQLDITFVGIEDNLATDHYLWLTGRARAMLRGEIAMRATPPAR